MKVGLFIPCYIDQFYPKVAIATLQLLEKLGCEVTYPLEQTCCGQPLANSGMEKEAIPVYRHFVDTFESYDYIVAPSGSCTYHVKHHYDVLPQEEKVVAVRDKTLDLAEFCLDILQIDSLEVEFPYKVGLHQSCHGLRGLRLGLATERMLVAQSKWHRLLGMVTGIEVVELDRPDECCGFGGTFAVAEAEVSVKMGKDRIADHIKNGVEVLTSSDMSCLMHLDGIIQRQKSPLKVIHLAEILNGNTP